MSTPSIKPLSTHFTARVTNANLPSEAKSFVRGAAASSAGRVAPAVARDQVGSMANWRTQVLAACENLGLNPGARKDLVVDGEPMVLRRTGSGDAYVFQTRADSINAPFNGLRIANSGEMQYNMETLKYDAESKPGFAQFAKLSIALGVPHGGRGWDDNGSFNVAGV